MNNKAIELLREVIRYQNAADARIDAWQAIEDRINQLLREHDATECPMLHWHSINQSQVANTTWGTYIIPPTGPMKFKPTYGGTVLFADDQGREYAQEHFNEIHKLYKR